ncbi:MAG TPA: hypothetical protein VGM73_11650 [Candidatus Didemnitutus sp.]
MKFLPALIARIFLRILPITALAMAAPLTRATSVVPPSFSDLVNKSDYIVRGVVKSVSSELIEDAQGRRIVTHVEIDVRQVIAGTPPAHLVLDMLGGTVGRETLTVHGAPKFAVGDEDILFIQGNGTNFNPLVAMMHGRYPILADSTGRTFVARNNGRPLYSEDDVSLPMESTSAVNAAHASAAPLTPDAFVAKIQAAHNPSSRSTLEN